MKLTLKATIGTSGRKLLLARTLAGCLLAAAAAFAQSTDQPDLRIEKIAENTYLTYGYGPTEPEARVSAIRNGLQFATQQAVNVETTVEAGEVIKDSLYSTMNAQVDRFTVTNVSAVGDEIYVQAELEITDSAIKATVDRYKDIGLGIQSRDAQQSAASASDVQAAFAKAFDQIKEKEDERRRHTANLPVARELYYKLFEGWPEDAYAIELDAIEIDKADPTKAEISIKVEYKKSWLEAFKTNISVLGELMAWAPEVITEVPTKREKAAWGFTSRWNFYMQKACTSFTFTVPAVANRRGNWPASSTSKQCFNTPAYVYEHHAADHWRWLIDPFNLAGHFGYLSKSVIYDGPLLGQVNGYVREGVSLYEPIAGCVGDCPPQPRRKRRQKQTVLIVCIFDEAGEYMDNMRLKMQNSLVLNPGLSPGISDYRDELKIDWTRDINIEQSSDTGTWDIPTAWLTMTDDDRYASFFSFHARLPEAGALEVCEKRFES